MARPVKTSHAPWRRLAGHTDGGCSCREGYSIGVLFLAKTTNREAFGRLRGIPPERLRSRHGGSTPRGAHRCAIW